MEGKAPSRAAARAGKCVSREPGVRLRGRGCRGQVTQALSNKKPEPQLTNCRGSGQRPAAIPPAGVLHQGCCNAPTVQPAPALQPSLRTGVGRASPNVQQRGRIPKDKVNSPCFLSKLCLHMCRSPSCCRCAQDECRSCRPGAMACMEAQASSWQARCSLQPCIGVGMLVPWCPHWLSLKNSKKLENRFFSFFQHLFLRDLNPPQETGGGRVKL